jgi:hypothetical protein
VNEIERFFPGVSQTRASSELAEGLVHSFEPAGLRVRKPWLQGSSVLDLVRRMEPGARLEASRDLFQRVLPLLKDGEHGAVHPGNILHTPEGLRLVDAGLNRARLFPFGAGPIPPEPGQLDYDVWLWGKTCPKALSWSDWDRACLLLGCTLLSRGPEVWDQRWDVSTRVEACEAWGEAWIEDLPQGAHDAARVRAAYAACLRLELL